MKIEMTEEEVKIVRFYLRKAIIDAEGMVAIGVGDKRIAKVLKAVDSKLWNALTEKGKDTGQANLYDVLNLLDLLDQDEETVYFQEEERKVGMPGVDIVDFKISEIKDKFDLQKTKVAKIYPYFYFGEYEGFLLIIQK